MFLRALIYAVCSLVLLAGTANSQIVVCDQWGCRGEGNVPARGASDATREHIIHKMTLTKRTASEARKNYFDLSFVDTCGVDSRLQQIALSFIESKPRSFWERLRSIGVADSKTYSLNVGLEQIFTTGTKPLGETSVVSYTLNQDGRVDRIDCDSRIASRLNANSDLKITFKFYVGKTPEANRRTAAYLRIAAKVGTFLVSNGLLSDVFNRPARLLASTADQEVSIGETFFKEFREVEELRVSKTLSRRKNALLLNKRPFLKKEYFDSAWAEYDEQGKLFNAYQDVGQAMIAQTNIDILPAVQTAVPDYQDNLVESTNAARRACNRIKEVFRGFASIVDQDVALYYILKRNADLLDGNVKYHCLDAQAVARLRSIGLTSAPYEAAYSRAPVQVARH